jgi:hypothetical protein
MKLLGKAAARGVLRKAGDLTNDGYVFSDQTNTCKQLLNHCESLTTCSDARVSPTNDSNSSSRVNRQPQDLFWAQVSSESSSLEHPLDSCESNLRRHLDISSKPEGRGQSSKVSTREVSSFLRYSSWPSSSASISPASHILVNAHDRGLRQLTNHKFTCSKSSTINNDVGLTPT